MTKAAFKHIALIGRAGKNIADTLIDVEQYLEKKHCDIVIEENTANMMPDTNHAHFSENNLPDDTDLMIVVGGDGSLLNAAHLALPHKLPVLGINRGRLGFLTDIHPDELDKIGNVLAGDYQTENRFLLEATIHTAKQTTDLGLALNDVVLLPGDLAHMIEFEIYINDQFVCQQRADGLIIATPTGSTAYALSGGGPILHPDLNAMVLVPMFPHTLSNRPVVIDGHAQIELRINDNNETSPYVSCDGQDRVAVNPGSRIVIQQDQQPLHLIHPKSYEYFKTLREKLGWQSGTRHN